MKIFLRNLYYSAVPYFALVAAVDAMPTITSVSTDKTAYVRSDIALEAQAESGLEISYQWHEGTNKLTHATNATLVVYSGNEPTTRQFFAVASDAEGSVTSRTVTVTITLPPRSETLTILQQPRSIFVRPGFSGSFSVSAESSSPLTYQWFKNGVSLENETNTSLVVTNAQIVNGVYDTRCQVRVSDAVGTLMSTSAVLTVLEPPKVYEQPGNQYVITGDNLDFTFSVSGTPPFHFEWFRNGRTIGRTSSPRFVITNAQSSHSGRYQVAISNRADLTFSRFVNFTVCDDLDQNQIPDCWQSAFGLSSELSGRDMDADNDGVSNYEEYVSGTNPMNAESLLKFSAIDTIGTNIAHLQFLASSNSSYTVQMQPSWFAPRWLKLTNILTQPTNQSISLMHTNLYSDYIFYRIVTPRVD